MDNDEEYSILKERFVNSNLDFNFRSEDPDQCKTDKNERITYLDFAGAVIPPKSLLNAIHNELINSPSSILGNPHSSQNGSKNNTSVVISQTRKLVLSHFGVTDSDYDVVFTSGSTASIKLVGESFPWTSDSLLSYSMNSHTSILGKLLLYLN